MGNRQFNKKNSSKSSSKDGSCDLINFKKTFKGCLKQGGSLDGAGTVANMDERCFYRGNFKNGKYEGHGELSKGT